MNAYPFAHAYATKGWQSFPLKPREKVPIVKWADVATCDTKMLNGWFDNYPDSNIGIACGKRSGIIAIDIDAAHGGFDSLTELIGQHGALPQTPTSKTGNGGEHILFKHPGVEIRNSAGKLGKGIDIRGDGGYIVAPPSVHPNGNVYEWVIRPSEVELADMPEWMVELLREPEKPREKEQVEEATIVEGGRNDYLTKMAGAMRRKGFSEDAIFSALQIDNREKCRPPLSDGEVLQISKSVMRYTAEDVPHVAKPLPDSLHVIELLEIETRERERDPKDVWGIHYAFPYLSLITGGKQKGELIYGAGEPGVGKSWFFHQDALFTAIGNPSKKIPEVPVLLWSGEMKRRQVYRRFFEMLGVPKRALLTGRMKETDKYTGELIDHWENFNEAKAILMNSPIYVADMGLDLSDVRALLEREMDAHGIQQAVFDYDWLITAPGSGEIEQSQNISRFMKQTANDLDISIILISSVNKGGMGQTSENVTKAHLSGSGKKLHDADVIYILTKFNENKNNDMGIMPNDYWKIATLHVEKAREMDFNLPGGVINYMRETPNPKFREMKNEGDKPSWMKG
jgi:replicative DNA helicase